MTNTTTNRTVVSPADQIEDMTADERALFVNLQTRLAEAAHSYFVSACIAHLPPLRAQEIYKRALAVQVSAALQTDRHALSIEDIEG